MGFIKKQAEEKKVPELKTVGLHSEYVMSLPEAEYRKMILEALENIQKKQDTEIELLETIKKLAE